jgi:hypothetical protein
MLAVLDVCVGVWLCVPSASGEEAKCEGGGKTRRGAVLRDAAELAVNEKERFRRRRDAGL